MTGMTGNVPYYGGRMTPAQAYAASHPTRPPSPPRPPSRPAPPSNTAPPSSPAQPRRDPLEALDQLLETGIVDQEEYEQLRARIAP
jgi:hypothetical protein